MTGVVDRLVTEDGVGELKLDNEQWMQCGSSTYLQYERAWEALVRTWQGRHPDVVFQLDETVDERSFPYQGLSLGPTWFEDDHVKNTSHPGATKLSAELSDLWQVAPWVPDSALGVPLFHDTLGTAADGTAGYQLPFALLGQATFWRDTTTLSTSDAAETRWWTTWYAAHRAAYSGLVLRDSTSDPIDAVSPVVLQPWDHTTRTGYLTVVRQGDGIPGPAPVHAVLQDLDLSRTYRLTDVRTGAVLGSYPGSVLATGIDVTMADQFRSRVIEVSQETPAADLPEAPFVLALPLLGVSTTLVVTRSRRRHRSREASGVL